MMKSTVVDSLKDEYHINTCIYHNDSFPPQTFTTTYLKHLMAVMVEMKEAKKAADVVKEVTHMVSIEWPKADPTIDSKWSSRELKLGSILEWALQALTKMKVSSAPTPIKRKRSFVNCRQVVLKKKVTRSVGYEQCSSSLRRISSIVCRNISALCPNDKCAHYNTKVALFGKERR